ncbi:beta strand repeat-containing protein [Methanobacterium sp.]|uniref:beta strand repeat-containing protein n=1 Tax=Methanobacterium sp. TaxID=2164 RepID=UPI002ABBFCBD|nr:Ig-like domain-containing protein [Methanobacterium sp.]MDY9922509.1 Ig-like domain-containing protein [Methanobacterium sp.]
MINNKVKNNMNHQKSKNFTIVFLLLTIMGIFFSLNITAASVQVVEPTIFVNGTSGNDTWDGTNPIHTTGDIGPKKTITNAIGVVESGGVVYIAKGTYNEHDINITKNLNLQGENQKDTIIDAKHVSRIFRISNGVQFKITNLTLMNGDINDNGGAIVYYYAFLNVTECTFINNTANGGGAIYNGRGNLTVTRNTFINNTANGGGAIASNYGYGTINENTFTDNKGTGSSGGGAILDYYAVLNIKNNKFTNNQVKNGGGGAIKNGGGNLTITQNTFINNTANGGGGGAILNNVKGIMTTIENNFSNNKANGGAGGGISNSKGTSNVINSNFTHNMANNGGAITSYLGYLNVNNSFFTNNTALYGGGAIHNEDITGNIINCTFTGNIVNDGGGGAIEQAYVSNGSLNVIKSSFIDNKATTNGGAITNYYAFLSANWCNFINNTANIANGEAISNGGAIYNGRGNLTVTRNTFINNTANGGGAIASNYGYGTINENTFTDNKGTGSSGGGAILDYYAVLNIKNNKFTNNQVKNGGGGAIKNGGGNLTITQNTFINNTANGGGAIFNYANGIVIINDGNFNKNIATTNGGAIANYYSSLNVTNSNFIGNIASGGGAVYDSGANAVIQFNRIWGNNAFGSYDIYCYNGNVDARFNWWSSNANPSGRVFSVSGSVNSSPWLILTITPTPKTVQNGGESTVTADLLHDSNGVYHNPLYGHVSNGILTTFGTIDNPPLGTLNPLTKTTINGRANTTFNADKEGTAHVSAKIDNQIVTASIIIPFIVTTIDPPTNAINVPVNKVIKIFFSGDIKAGPAYESISLKNIAGWSVLIDKSISGNVLSIALTRGTYLPNNQYILNLPINSISDLANNNLKTAYTTTFTTAPKTT